MPRIVLWTCVAALALSTVVALASPEGAFVGVEAAGSTTR